MSKKNHYNIKGLRVGDRVILTEDTAGSARKGDLGKITLVRPVRHTFAGPFAVRLDRAPHITCYIKAHALRFYVDEGTDHRILRDNEVPAASDECINEGFDGDGFTPVEEPGNGGTVGNRRRRFAAAGDYRSAVTLQFRRKVTVSPPATVPLFTRFGTPVLTKYAIPTPGFLVIVERDANKCARITLRDDHGGTESTWVGPREAASIAHLLIATK